MSTTTKWLAGLNAILGLWLITAAFVFGVAGAAMWNAIIVGGTIALLGWYNYSRTTDGNEVSLGAAGVNVLLGLWVIVAPFLFNPGTTALWNDVIVGALVALFGAYNGYAATTARKQTRTQPA